MWHLKLWSCYCFSDWEKDWGLWLYHGRHFFSTLSLYSFTLPKSHIQMDGLVLFSQVKVKPPIDQLRRSETLVCPDSRTAKATPAPLNFSWLRQIFGVALGLQRKFIWQMYAKGRWPLGFCLQCRKGNREG